MNAQRWRHSPGLTQVILEKTIIKLGSLLALGFGEASVFKAPRDVASLFSQFAPGWCEHHWAQHAWRRQRLRWCALASFESGLPSEKGQCFRKKEAFFNRTMPSNAQQCPEPFVLRIWVSCWVMLSHAESCCPRTADGQAMVEGTRVECIIGATRIRDFSTATEVQLFFCQVTGELVGLNC